MESTGGTELPRGGKGGIDVGSSSYNNIKTVYYRLAQDRVASKLSNLEEELGRAQEVGNAVAVDCRNMFDIVKDEMVELLDAQFEVVSQRLVRIHSLIIWFLQSLF